MLRKVLLLVFSTILLASCGIDHTDFSGDWIEKENENDRMIIKKNGDNYLVENRGKKYAAQIKDGLLEISSELPIKATIDENDNLIVSGEEYIRVEKSILNKYFGYWDRIEGEPYSGMHVSITNDGNNIKIDVIIEDEEYGVLPTEYRNVKYKNKELTFKKWGSEGGFQFTNYGKFKMLDNGLISEIIDRREFGKFKKK